MDGQDDRDIAVAEGAQAAARQEKPRPETDIVGKKAHLAQEC